MCPFFQSLLFQFVFFWHQVVWHKVISTFFFFPSIFNTEYSVLLFPVWFAVGKPVINVLAVASRVGEPLEALRTLERLLAGVETSVLRQMVLVLKGLVTISALVGALI